MRKITVDIIASEHFDIEPQGYSQKQVDDFLNEICDYLEFGMSDQSGAQADPNKDAEIQRLKIQNQQLESKLSMASSSQVNNMELDRKEAEIQKLNSEITRLQSLVKAAQHESAEARAKLEIAPKNDLSSESAEQVLMNAQKVYDMTLEKANTEVKEIKESAQKEADAQIGSLKSEKENLENELKNIKEKFEENLNNYEGILNSLKSSLDESRAKVK